MSEHTIKEDVLNILRVLSSNEGTVNQRDLSANLGISLGKTNYLIKELIKKGLVKARNFSSGDGKLCKIRYILTKKGLDEYLVLTYEFLQRKELEYKNISQEWKRLSVLHNDKDNKETRHELKV